mgnify:CR=1 FL=1
MFGAVTALTAAAAASSDICDGVNMSNISTSEYLRGKHLHVMMPINHEPFGIIDASAPRGWVGVDIDMLNLIADMLDFTYYVTTFNTTSFTNTSREYKVNELALAAAEADLITAYWTPTQDRMEHVFITGGHVDISSVVVGRRRTVEPSFTDRAFAFLHPFSPALWATLIGMVLVAGLVDYLLERKAGGGKLGASVYEYMAGALFGGFAYPRSKSTAVYQIMMAIVFVFIFESYVANLTAFLTLRTTSELSATSLASIMEKDLKACDYPVPDENMYFTNLYPTLNIELQATTEDAFESLMSGSCDALIMKMSEYNRLRTRPEACTMQVVETVRADSAGWVTNREGSCVQEAIDWAVRGLEVSGELQKILQKWLAASTCSRSQASSGSRRRLQAISSRDHGHRRRLEQVPTRGRSLSSMSPSKSEETEDEPQPMTTMDFVSLIGVFLVGTTIIFATLLVDLICSKFESLGNAKQNVLMRFGWASTEKEKLRRNVRMSRLEVLLLTAGVNRDDRAGLLAELLLQVDDLKQALGPKLMSSNDSVAESSRPSESSRRSQVSVRSVRYRGSNAAPCQVELQEGSSEPTL